MGLFKKEKIIDYIKSSKITAKQVIYSTTLAAVLTTVSMSSNSLMSLKIGFSEIIPGYSVSYDASKKINNSGKIDNLNYVFDERGSGKYKSRAMYVATMQGNEIEINGVGSIADIFVENIKMSHNIKESEQTSRLDNIPLLAKLGISEELKYKLPLEVKKIINVDIDNGSPSIAYLDNKGIINYTSFEKYGVFNDAKTQFLTVDQYKDKDNNLDNVQEISFS